MIEKTAVASLFILAMSTIPVGVLCYSIKKHSAKLKLFYSSFHRMQIDTNKLGQCIKTYRSQNQC